MSSAELVAVVTAGPATDTEEVGAMTSRRFITPVLSAILITGASAAAFEASAAETAKPPAMTTHAAAKTAPDLRVSSDGYLAMRDVRGARIALMTGDPDLAAALVKRAQSRIDAAGKDAFTLAADTAPDATAKGTAAPPMRYIALDASSGVDETMVLTPEAAGHVAKAKAHMKAGNRAAAREELRLASVDVSTSVALAPADATKAGIDHAASLLGKGDNYQALLALNGVEDGIVIRSFSVDEFPTPQTVAAAKPQPANPAEPAHAVD